eukprot:gene2750-2944_t
MRAPAGKEAAGESRPAGEGANEGEAGRRRDGEGAEAAPDASGEGLSGGGRAGERAESATAKEEAAAAGDGAQDEGGV